MISWLALLLVWVIPFIVAGQTEKTVTAIAQEWLPFRIVYACVALVSVLCAAHRFVRDRSRNWEQALRHRLDADGRGAASTTMPVEDAVALLGAKRFRVAENRDNSVLLTRNRTSAYGGALFHLGIALVAAALVVHGATVSTASFELIEGQSVEDSFVNAGRPGEDAALYRALRGIKLESVEPRFFGPYLLFEKLDAKISDRGVQRVFSLARPLWIDAVTNLSIQDFDVAPRFVVYTETGQLAEDSTISIDLYPPGEDRTIRLDTAKANVSMRLFTDYEVRDGRPASGSYNLKDVRLLTTVISRVTGAPDRIVARKTLAVGDSVSVNDFTVKIADLRTAGTFRVTRAPALPFVIVATLIACAGLALRVLLRRVDVLVVATEDGARYVANEDLVGRAWGERTVARVLEGGGEKR